jgi:RimJ/RimL family protein N-acetyltransferase
METDFKFDSNVKEIFKSIKDGKYQKRFFIPVYDNNQEIAILKPVTRKNLEDTEENREIIKLFAKWRNENSKWYPTIFKVTEEGTKNWLKDQVIETEDRLLFIVESPEGIPVGHMGFYRGEADNFIRGRNDILKGGMTYALKAMLEWAFDDLKINKLFLRVFEDNKKAVSFYKRCGFKGIYKIPLKKTEDNNVIKWEEIPENSTDKAERFFSVMCITNKSKR